MGLWDALRSLLGFNARRPARPDPGLPATRAMAEPGRDTGQLAQRLGVPLGYLETIQPQYRTFTIPKWSGAPRTILAPQDDLKQLQRTILRRLLGRLASHRAVTGFERGHSIVTNARVHIGAAVVIRMDLKDFFPTTKAARVGEYFRLIGWNDEAAALLMRLCTHGGSLPQGAPTSPRLSNLVNYRMDARLAALAAKLGAAYTRYADDITFSLGQDCRWLAAAAIRGTKAIVADYGYTLHQKRKLIIRRRHQSQRVTGLVVNERVALPRSTRRRLRAIRHCLDTGRPATLTASQLAGWDALEHMIRTQSRSE
ncbi:MAG: RNA-directed DNA polymerase [Planctomycetes bacterium]|nr:RNA-directed DNA polymerase [Planctomycetota bacterium]